MSTDFYFPDITGGPGPDPTDFALAPDEASKYGLTGAEANAAAMRNMTSTVDASTGDDSTWDHLATLLATSANIYATVHPAAPSSVPANAERGSAGRARLAKTPQTSGARLGLVKWVLPILLALVGWIAGRWIGAAVGFVVGLVLVMLFG